MDSPHLGPGTVKICSLRERAQAEFVVAAGADLFGLIFAESRRQVTPEKALEIVTEARMLAGASSLRAVGIFVDQPAGEINRIAETVGLDFVQLHGDEPPEFAALIERPVIRAIRTRPGMAVGDVGSRVTADGPTQIAAVLVDGYHASEPGGSGSVANWALASEVAARYPVMLAGGLTPDTVALAIAAVRPLGVDVSSGVEIEGRKDRARIIDFVREARTAFAALAAQSSMST